MASIMKNIEFCVPIRVPKDRLEQAIRRAIEQNPDNAAYSPDYPDDDDTRWPRTSHLLPTPFLGLQVNKLWPIGTTLRVLFLGGSSYVQSKVKEHAVIWSQFANINLQFVDSAPSHIRIGFTPKIGSWSAVGTDNLTIHSEEATMNFSTFNDNTPAETFARVTAHEFGHALGAIHEHQQPHVTILWNKSVVYAAYAEKGWTKAEVDDNLFSRYSSDLVSSTEHDRLSIMQYPIPSEFTLDGWSAPTNTTLSGPDRSSIRRRYPFPNDAVKVDTGIFNTLSTRSHDQPSIENKTTVRFIKAFPRPPKVLVGLNWLEFGKLANLRIRALVDNVQINRMDVNLQSWADSVNYSSGAAYFLCATEDRKFQSGQFDTRDDHDWAKPQPQTNRYIKFEQPFSTPPNVVIFLTSLDIDNRANIRVKTYTSDITADGFTIHVDSWGDTRLWSTGVTWLAYPSEERMISIGTYSTDDIRSRDQLRLENTGTATFANGGFDHPPRIFMALNALEIDNTRDARLRLSASNVSTDGFRWHIDSWSDTILYYAGASFIAF